LGIFYNFTRQQIFAGLFENTEVLDFQFLSECVESKHIWAVSAPTNCDVQV